MYSYLITSSNDNTTASVTLEDGSLHVIRGDHPRSRKIVEALISGVSEEDLRDLLNTPGSNIATYLEALTDRISYGDNGGIYFDGEVLPGVLSDAIAERYRRGYENITPMLNFLENLMQNPNAESREQLYNFLTRHGLSITASGNFLAYKGVNTDGFSVHAGYGIVNGEVIEHGRLDNAVGNVVEFPRSRVSSDATKACDVGLHVGSYQYATGFAPRLVGVEVNPRDVVSVPLDYDNAKVRVCRYVVRTSELNEAWDDLFYNDDLSAEDYDIQEDEDGYYEDFIAELKGAVSSYSMKGKVANSYADLAEALGYGRDNLEYYFAEKLDLSHTANAVYRYHIEAL
ncbi:MAG: hypothetical protein WC965_01540 [Thiohalomonadaceae bacterium]